MPGHGKGWLRIAIDDYIETGGWWERFKDHVEARIDGAENAIREAHPGVFEAIEDALPDDVPLAKGIKDGISGKSSGGIAAIAGIAVGLGIAVVQGMVRPLSRLVGYGIDRMVHSARLDPGSVNQAIWRKLKPDEDWIADLEHQGFSPERISVIGEILKPKVGVTELLTQWLRHDRQDSLIDGELAAQGWTSDRISIIKELTEVIPGVGDLISMAVREAWRDDIAARFEYDADFPGEVVEWAEKQGLSAEWVKRYWRAHWVLPSIGQGFAMLHRLRDGTTDNPFSMDDLQTLLRISDIPAFFRERLTEIAYTPLTRVDVRRMYGMDVLDADGVKNAYLDGGYNEKNAELMTEFTIKFETQEQRDLTRSVIVSAYERSVMGRGEAKQSIIDIGYSDVNAELFLAIADTKIAESRQKDRLDRAEFMYVEGLLDETGVYAELGDLNLPAEQAADLIVRWEITKLKKISLATKSELEDLYKRDIIDRDRYRDGMEKRRYDETTISWYTERLDMRVAEDAAKDLERTQKEQERVEKADFATAYQRTKAAMDVEIAAIKLQLADIKLAINYMTEAADIAMAKTVMLELKVDIADWQLAKAEVRLDFTQVLAMGE